MWAPPKCSSRQDRAKQISGEIINIHVCLGPRSHSHKAHTVRTGTHSLSYGTQALPCSAFLSSFKPWPWEWTCIWKIWVREVRIWSGIDKDSCLKSTSTYVSPWYKYRTVSQKMKWPGEGNREYACQETLLSKPLLGFRIEDGQEPSCPCRPARMAGTAVSWKQLLLISAPWTELCPLLPGVTMPQLPAVTRGLEEINNGSNFPFPFSCLIRRKEVEKRWEA